MSKLVKYAARLALAASTLCTSAAWGNKYEIVSLSATPEAINNSGQIAANGAGKSFPRGKIFRGGKWHNLPPHSRARAMNEQGDVVGSYEGGQFLRQGGFWPRKGLPVQIEDNVVPHGVSRDRLVVGVLAGDRCFAWSLDTGFIPFDGFDPGNSCYALAMNNAGVATGGAAGGSKGTSPSAFIWKSGKITDLGVLPGHSSARGKAINEMNHVVGYSSDSDREDPFYWNGSSMIALDPNKTGSRYTWPLSINNNDEIVGFTSSDGLFDSHAVRFEDKKVIQLASEVVNLGNWELEEATGISDDGIIVGKGNLGGFMLVPIQ